MSPKAIAILLIGILAVVGLYLAEQYWLKPSTQQVRTDGPGLMEPMPDATLQTREGTEVDLSRYRGKTLVINFWASWCLPCRAEMPFMNQVYNEFKDRDVVFLGVSEDAGGWPDVDGFLQELREKNPSVEIDYPMLLDRDGSVGEAFGGLIGLPTTVFVNREGLITKKHSSIIGIDQLRDNIRLMLGEPAQAAGDETDTDPQPANRS